MNKQAVAILGATGIVGQKFISLLEKHPQFKIAELVASPRSSGKKYREAVNWKQGVPIPEEVADMRVLSLDSTLRSPILFSGLDSSIAGEAETAFASEGHTVISNAKNHRMDTDVPIIIPEINADHFNLIRQQPYKGHIITNSNCATMVLAMVLAPLNEAFGLESVYVSTMQAISGAGYSGVPSMDILGNVIPYIAGEEEKLESEALKILGKIQDDHIEPASFIISAQCNRVPVLDGHSENISVKLKTSAGMDDITQVLINYRGHLQKQLYSSPESFIVLHREKNRPQPLLDVWTNKGMSAVIGRIRPCPIGDVKMTILGHNTIRGAAGAAVINAEAMLALGYL